MEFGITIILLLSPANFSAAPLDNAITPSSIGYIFCIRNRDDCGIVSYAICSQAYAIILPCLTNGNKMLTLCPIPNKTSNPWRFTIPRNTLYVPAYHFAFPAILNCKGRRPACTIGAANSKHVESPSAEQRLTTFVSTPGISAKSRVMFDTARSDPPLATTELHIIPTFILSFRMSGGTA